MVRLKAHICNEYGIHCRPSAVIAKDLQAYPGTITIVNDSGARADAKSILALIGLAIKCGTQVEIEVAGPDEEETCARVVKLFETNFDFPR